MTSSATTTKSTPSEVLTPIENLCPSQPRQASKVTDWCGEVQKSKYNDSEDDSSDEEPDFFYSPRGKQVLNAAGSKGGSNIRPPNDKRTEEEKKKAEEKKKLELEAEEIEGNGEPEPEPEPEPEE